MRLWLGNQCVMALKERNTGILRLNCHLGPSLLGSCHGLEWKGRCRYRSHSLHLLPLLLPRSLGSYKVPHPKGAFLILPVCSIGHNWSLPHILIYSYLRDKQKESLHPTSLFPQVSTMARSGPRLNQGAGTWIQVSHTEGKRDSWAEQSPCFLGCAFAGNCLTFCF